MSISQVEAAVGDGLAAYWEVATVDDDCGVTIAMADRDTGAPVVLRPKRPHLHVLLNRLLQMIAPDLDSLRVALLRHGIELAPAQLHYPKMNKFPQTFCGFYFCREGDGWQLGLPVNGSLSWQPIALAGLLDLGVTLLDAELAVVGRCYPVAIVAVVQRDTEFKPE